MRASTLKALLIHTADDKGNAGPDYEYGWGLINVQAAAELLATYRSNAGTRRVVEDRVATSRTQVDVAFAWDGSSPIKATLCWTDPAGTATASHDDRARRLVNNLDLRVIGPDAAIHRPWVMPFVGDWSVASCAYAAITGSNATDTVEQVLIAAPAVAGVYTARVTFAGTLTNGSQPFSLILSGVTPSQRAPAPVLTASSPSSGSWFDVTASGSGAAFAANGYTTTLNTTGSPTARNPLAGRSAWSGTSPGFVKVVVNLTDTAKYAGHSLRIRWRLGTDSSTASAGWYVDDVTLSGIGDPPPVPLQGTLLRVH